MSVKIEQIQVEEYVGTFNDFVTNEEKVFIFKAASEKDAAQKCREHFNIKSGRVDLMAGYINPTNNSWLISFNARSWLKASAWERYVSQAQGA